MAYSKSNNNGRGRKIAITCIGLVLYTMLIVIVTATRINKEYQGEYISMSAYLAAEQEVSLLQDKVKDLEIRFDEQEAKHKTEIDIYDSQIEILTEELRKYKEDESDSIKEHIKYEAIPSDDNPSKYRSISLTSEARSPVTKLTSTEMNDLVNAICERRACDGEDPTRNPFYNTGKTFYDMECETEINAMYVMAIFTVESGFGKDMIKPNNAGGITGSNGRFKSFDSINECISYTGGLLSRYRDNYDLETIDEIASRYCPVNPEWASRVREFVSTYSEYV